MNDLRLTGWKKDKYDSRDFLHKRAVIAMPESVTFKDLLPEVRNQGQNGACVGFAIAANLSAIAKTLGIFTEWYSPQWIWNGARAIEGTLAQNVGVYPRDALDWLLKSGILLEQFWPYNPDSLDMAAPSSERQEKAKKYRGFAYYRVTEGVQGICSAIAFKHLVTIGSPWFSKWMQTQDGILPVPDVNDGLVGGHETCLYGYDQVKAVFYGMNSWGTSWGDKGFFTIPFECFDLFKALGGYDAHFITFVNDPEPEPVPVPDPVPEPIPSNCPYGNGMAKALNFLQERRSRRGRFYYLNPK
jgi:hypothetical protein